MKTDILREKFLDFFKSKKHKIVESDSLLPKDDPTVLFTPAGMNQFKKEFLGLDSGFRRAATAQRCLRTDDLDKVGKTRGHHTFFEMLGNFSFGDYFKEDAIAWAWEFLTKELKIEGNKLWFSVYKDDAEAFDIWKGKIGIPQQRIIKLGDKENFWPSEAKANGPNGPCGPCSEIFFDRGKDSGCTSEDCNPSCNCGRFLEVWNLVFTQFNRKDGGALEPLPQKNIDTGMGLERLAAVMQDAPNNFETDLFKPLIKEIIAGLKNSDPKKKELLYAVSDHIRAIVFAIYDGVLPSNESRGYVIRKLIRKSCLHLRTLEIKKPFLYKLVPVVTGIMKNPYPELALRRENIAEIILAEEKNFYSTLASSQTLFKEKFATVIKNHNAVQAGCLAFQLYDTYGIPFELSKDWLQGHGVKISEDAFKNQMDQQKSRSKSQSTMKGDVFDIKKFELGIPATKFSGYSGYEVKSKILKIVKGNSEVKSISQGEEAEIILDKTCFYPESGGQIGDTGELTKAKNSFEVLEALKLDKVIIHRGRVKEGSLKKMDIVSAKIDAVRRHSIARNHTATHLLQAALRKVLGNHVQQQGSLVAADRLRFDFTHFKNLTEEQLDRIEETINSYILNNLDLATKEMALSKARKSKALAFFQEKYEEKVRVVFISDISKELCGGTHLESTGQIGLFKIIQEGSVASGIRRIEAVTGTTAYKIVKDEEKTIAEVSNLLGVPKNHIVQEVEKRTAKIKELEKQLNSQKLANLQASLEELIQAPETINGIKVITKILKDLDLDTLRKTLDLIKQKTDNAIIALGSNNGGKVLLVMGVTADLCAKGIDASNLIREVSRFIGGSGGGRKDFAQAGGNNPENIEKAFMEFKNIISKIKL